MNSVLFFFDVPRQSSAARWETRGLLSNLCRCTGPRTCRSRRVIVLHPEAPMEPFLFLTLVIAYLALLDGLWGSGALLIALRAAARIVRRRHPRIADKLGLGKEVRDAEHLNDCAGALMGRVAVVEQAIVAGRGRLAID